MNAPMNDRTMLGDLMAHRAAQKARKSAMSELLEAAKEVAKPQDEIDESFDAIRNIECDGDKELAGKRNLFLESW